MKGRTVIGPPEHVRKASFERARIGIPPKEERGIASSGHGELSALPTHRSHISTRTEHFDVSPTDMPALSLDLGPMCLVSVTGQDVDTYSMDLHSEVCCEDQEQAEALLQRLVFKREDGTFVLKTPPNFGPIRSQCYLDVVGPAYRPVIITGAYVKVEVSAVTAPVTVATSHSSTSLFEVSGRVDASARDGVIVFVGNRGDAYLDADLGIDIKLTERDYHGTIRATAAGPVFALIPSEFITPFEVNVTRAEQAVFQTELLSKLKRQKEKGMVVVTHGSNPQSPLKFVSRGEMVSIDTYSTG